MISAFQCFGDERSDHHRGGARKALRTRRCKSNKVMSFAEQFEDLRIWQEAREQVSAIYRSMMRGSAGHSDFGFGTSCSAQRYQ